MFTIGELYMVRGELVILTGYNKSLSLALFENEAGDRVEVGPGLIRKAV
ncbi:hypothetical protein [Streptomyces mutomycini]